MDGSRYIEGYRTRLNDSTLKGIHRELDPSVHSQFFVNCVQMGLHGALTDRELHGNFLVAKAGGNHFDDFRFASRENLDDFLRFFALRESVERAADERRLESALAALHAAIGVDQIDRRR